MSSCSVCIGLGLRGLARPECLTLAAHSARSPDRDRLLDVVGFPAGEVPPFGFRTDGIVRIIDDTLVSEGALVRFGPEEGFVVIRGADLSLDGGVVASVGEDAREPSTTTSSSSEDDNLRQIVVPGALSPFNNTPVQFDTLLRVVRKRKLAKRLLFATVVPGDAGGRHAYGRNLRTSGSLVWRHPVTSEPCELQMIIGKTIERRYGPKVMDQILKRVVKGGYVRITGVLQANTKNDACVDVVVHDLETFRSSLTGLAAVTPPMPLVSSTAAPMTASSGASGASGAGTLPASRRPQQTPYVNLSTLKGKKKKNRLSEEDLVPEYRPARTFDVTPVADMGALLRLREALIAASAVSLDAEWRPSTQQGRSNPVSLLQVGVVGSDPATMDVFLVDMLELCFYKRDVDFGGPLTDEQIVLSDLLEAMFGNVGIYKLGFGLRYDVKRLRESYPWLPCFRGHASVSSHVDLGMLGRLAGKIKAHKNLSLSKLTAAVLNVRLSKEQQMSDWGSRPLTGQQISYASNDVSCLVDIYDALVAGDADILSSPKAREFVSLNLNELGRGGSGGSGGYSEGDEEGQLGGNGSGSGWYSGSNEEGQFDTPVLSRPRPPKKLPLKSCTADPTMARRFLGEYVDRSGKEGAVTALVGVEEAKKYNGAPRGGALIEMSNAFLLFVNVPSRNYPNEFSAIGDEDGGRGQKMSWFSSRGQTLDHPVIKRLLDAERTVTLWCRRDRERYAFFGELNVDSVEEQADGTLKVWFRLVDWEAIRESATVRHVLAANQL